MRSLLVALMLLVGVSAHAQGVSVLFKTTPTGGQFAPRNVVAVWITDNNGTFVKTIGRWADVRRSDLVAWNQASGGDADAVSGATRLDHSVQLAAQWDLTSKAGAVMPDGTYQIHIETSDSQTGTTAPNHEAVYTFVKSASPQVQLPADANGYIGVKVTYASMAGCDNGIIDIGEKCDPIASCPTSCETTDACMPQILLGDAATCSSSCLAEVITTCKSGDGCCPMGCDATTDSDCGPGGGGGGQDNGNNVSGGCAAGGTTGGAFASLIVGLAALVLFRRRAT